MNGQVYLFTGCEYDRVKIKKKITSTGVMTAVKPGDTVVIKPNFVQESHDDNDDWDYVITHPEIVSAVLELTCDALDGNGEIIIADSPMTPTKFDELIAHFPVEQWKETCTKGNIELSIIDLRDEQWINADNGIILKAEKLPGDPKGKVICNLKDDRSEFFGKKTGSRGYYGADYDIKETNDAHNGSDNKYSVSRSVIDADIIINLPKLKCHKKAGITCCLKNLVGINTNKNLIPHHSTGTPAEGGDQFESDSGERKLESAVTVCAKQLVHKFKFLTPLLVPLKNLAVKAWGDNRQSVRSGGWYGNDTLWRAVVDLNKVMFYANSDGTLRPDAPESRKRYIAIVDGILAGEKNGPLAPDKVEAGFLLAGTDPAATDRVAAEIMGFDWKKIPSVYNSFLCRRYKITDSAPENIEVSVNGGEFINPDRLPDGCICHFVPANGWTGHIEKNS